MGLCHSKNNNQYEILHFLNLAKGYCIQFNVHGCQILTDLNFDQVKEIFLKKYPTSSITIKNKTISISYSEKDFAKLR